MKVVMPEPVASSTVFYRSVLAGFVIRTCVWLSAFLVCVFVVPRFIRLFNDFELELPAITVWTIQISNVFVRHGGYVLVIVLLLIMADGIISSKWTHNHGGMIGATIWLMFALPVLLLGLTIIGIGVPLIKLMAK